MSIDSARIVCTGCNYETRELYQPILIRYQTTNGKSIKTGRTKGWCYDCASYSNIERMNQGELSDKLVSKELELLEARHRQDELNRGFFSKFRHRSEKNKLQYQLEYLDKEIIELVELLKIAKSRKSKARCLKCWSDRTAPVTFGSEDNIAHDFEHECGGHLQIIHDHSGPRFNFSATTYVLNEEGELIGED